MSQLFAFTATPRLTELMAHQGRTINWLASTIHRSRFSTGRMVRGEVRVTAETTTLVSVALGVPASWLFADPLIKEGGAA
jgi:plasmid maintenance system antidote protein VapI